LDVASIRLRYRCHKSHAIDDATTIRMDDFALLVRVAVPGQPAVAREAIFDTGAPFTVFPQSIWTQFQSRIRWVGKLNDPNLPRWCKQFAGVAGGTIQARLGRVAVTLHEPSIGGATIGPINLLAMFALDHGKMAEKDILLGLGGGTLAGRIVELDYDAAAMHVHDK